MLRCLFYFLNYMLFALLVVFMAGVRYFPRLVEDVSAGSINKPVVDEKHIVEMVIAPRDGQYERPIRQLTSTDWQNLEANKDCFLLVLDRIVLSESDMIRIGRFNNLRQLRFEKSFILTDIACMNLEEHRPKLEAVFEQENAEEQCEFFNDTLCSKRVTDLLLRIPQVDNIGHETSFFPVNRDRFAESQRLYQLSH